MRMTKNLAKHTAVGHLLWLLRVAVVHFVGPNARRPEPKVTEVRLLLHPLVIFVKVRVGQPQRLPAGHPLPVLGVRPLVVAPQQLHAVVKVMRAVAKKPKPFVVGHRVQLVILPVPLFFVHRKKTGLHLVPAKRNR